MSKKKLLESLRFFHEFDIEIRQNFEKLEKLKALNKDKPEMKTIT